MTWIKICGITTEEALEAADLGGADAVGFVVAPSSPRAVTLERARTMIARTNLPAYLVSVDATVSDLERAVMLTGAVGVQPHGRHRRDVAVASASHGWSVLFPIPMSAETPDDPDAVPGGVVPLLDSASGAVHGGTGSTFDWSRIDDRYRPFVLAGGLGVDNVAEAIRAVQPYGVDASSRLEAAPGVKDPDTIQRFIEQAKSA